MAQAKKGSNKKFKKSTKEAAHTGMKKPSIRSMLEESEELTKMIQSSKVITVYELAKQTGVKVSAANAFLKKMVEENKIRRVGGFSGHWVYQPVA